MLAGMKTQNQIKRTLSQPEAIKQINNILDANININRSKLADLICDQFNFFNPCGETQRSGCLKALRKLEQDNFFVLPAPRKTGSAQKSPRRLEKPVPDPQGVPNDVEKICELKLVSVETEEYMRIWNELMIQNHSVLLVGQVQVFQDDVDFFGLILFCGELAKQKNYLAPIYVKLSNIRYAVFHRMD
jgi:hypothetical protein